jgi:Domain of unknown function (DUF374)
VRIRHPAAVKMLALGGACGLRLWMGTLRFRYFPLGEDVNPHRQDLKGRYIYAIWHENILLPVHLYSRAKVWVLISHHSDGQLLTELGRHLRLRLVRGSTNVAGCARFGGCCAPANEPIWRLRQTDHAARDGKCKMGWHLQPRIPGCRSSRRVSGTSVPGVCEAGTGSLFRDRTAGPPA